MFVFLIKLVFFRCGIPCSAPGQPSTGSRPSDECLLHTNAHQRRKWVTTIAMFIVLICLFLHLYSFTPLPLLFHFSFNNSTGFFTVPPGGDGMYYFSISYLVNVGHYARFVIMVNGEKKCMAYGDGTAAHAHGTCQVVHY